ncbi:hypothetical protein Dsin_030780 [Dipteronia sinensis]|uniref:Uncharacterized protein n=1 Tax=Dipteronia sinensis TaxID=43782 RepID=A0AAD9ZLP5_9ROSI|nr:hypothetical protein Dsin_030780 [Dipteronia sinensis]
MEKSQIITKEKLQFSGMMKEALRIPFKNPNFILFFLLASLSLFFFLVLSEIIFLQSLIQILDLLMETFARLHGDYGYYTNFYGWQPMYSIREMIGNVSEIRLLSSLLLLGIIHLLDLVNTIITVYAASVIYAGEANNPMGLKQIICTPITKVGFKGPLITSVYALLLSSLAFLGMLSLAMNMYFATDYFLILVFGMPLMVLLTKHIEWSGIWNMGTVISILEEKHGDVAIWVSAYLSKGCRKSGFLLAFVFFAWKIALRLSCFYYLQSHKGRIGLNVLEVIGGKVCLVCVGNFMMWVGFVVYYYDCKNAISREEV